MKASEFIGKTVIDQKGLEIGKVTDILLKPEECLIHKVIISDAAVLNKKYFTIDEGEIEAIGDYVIIKMLKKEAEARMGKEDVDSLKKIDLNFKKLVGKIVITRNGVELGNVEDLIVQPKECLMENIIVKSKSDLGKKNFNLEKGEILDIKDYLILKIDFEDIENRII